MKLAGRWVTVNSKTRFVRDEPEPPAPLPVLRLKDYEKKPQPPIRRIPDSPSPKWYSSDLRSVHLQAHRRLLEKRARGIYDKPAITPYALGLIRISETGGAFHHDPLHAAESSSAALELRHLVEALTCRTTFL